MADHHFGTAAKRKDYAYPTDTRCVSENSCLIAGILSLHCILEASFYT